MGDEYKTPEERANDVISKTLGRAIAARMLEIKQHEAAIKKLQREIKKIKDGELVPDEDEDESSHTHKCKHCHCEKIVERIIQQPTYPYQPIYTAPTPPRYYTWNKTSPVTDRVFPPTLGGLVTTTSTSIKKSPGLFACGNSGLLR